MKLIDTYYNYKEKYRDYVVLIKSGIFYEIYGEDIGIIYSLFHYKIRRVGNNYNIGFPINSIGDVCNILDNKEINYVIVDGEVKKYKNNNYCKYLIDINRIGYLNKRIDNISNRLCNKIMDNNIEEILFKIESII